ncbi:MAP protein 1 [Cytospora mali]|uniref:MAP protein 1 n=1 Tax=Cytospora mali TaxID=578113 RepID=A0A194VGA2_CYTMA|nr:MAP protein 1 [Valsa mali var. pyri (nom. inval.)]
MEQVHGIDVSWMTHHGGPKDRTPSVRRASIPPPTGPTPPDSTEHSPVTDAHNSHDHIDAAGKTNETQPRSIPPRPGFSRGGPSGEKNSMAHSASPTRRPSWFSNISQKFSGSGGQSPPIQATNPPTKDAEISVPKITPAKNAVLQHAARHQGEGPYTPAPPRSGQTGILQVFRRLSSSSPGQLRPALKGANSHGLVERRVLNVDQHRERCPLEELHQAKLRRVAFCVDVEIAPMPKYGGDEHATAKVSTGGNKNDKRKLVEKGEGEALKNPKIVEEQKEHDGLVKVSGEHVPKEPEKEGEQAKDAAPATNDAEAPADPAGGTKKKEKKKKSEEERKARKEKKRKLAEANGQVPLEIHLDTDTSDPSAPATPKPQAVPTTNPVRIYRRCCQLRETPILKKITEQLMAPSNTTPAGVVEKLDLSDYWMQLADLVTLGDYLAVVPVKEVVLENCGLTDEGLRVVLAGLLATRKIDKIAKRRSITVPDGLVEQGGMVERLVLKNNKIGPEGWKHICLFLYMCRSLVSLDVADVPFPKTPQQPATNGHGLHFHYREEKAPVDICTLLAKSIGERLGGSTLELINLSNTGLSPNQLGQLLDGIMLCGVRRLGLAHLDLDVDGLEHIKRYLTSGKCEGLDLGGNDLRDQCENISSVLDENNGLWALSLAECNLRPASLCKLLPQLSKLSNFRFLDLSHNQDLFNSDPSAVAVLRRYLPKMESVKRIHLSDCALKSDQLIALAEVIPEMKSIAHISFLQNPELTKLAGATTEETQEEASALYASLLAATRISPSLVCVDIDVPTENTGEIVKALAKQIVAYSLRNLERLPFRDGEALNEALANGVKDPEYPDVLQHLVGHDVTQPDDSDGEDLAPDDDYIVGGTGVAKALACCLDNRGDASRRNSGEFVRDLETGVPLPKSKLPAGKAKDVSKHLLLSARKIRHRLEPALAKAKVMSDRSTADRGTYRRLLFLQTTLDGIIKRFEDEFPETKEEADSAVSVSPPDNQLEKTTTRNSLSSAEVEPEPAAGGSDADEDQDHDLDLDVRRPGLARTNSNMSISSQALNREEGRALRTGHKFRSGWMTSEQYQLLSSAGFEELEKDAHQVRIFNELIDELDDEEINRLREEKGAAKVFEENRQMIVDACRAADPEYWARFVESQEKAKANVKVAQPKCCSSSNSSTSGGSGGGQVVGGVEDEEAVTD